MRSHWCVRKRLAVFRSFPLRRRISSLCCSTGPAGTQCQRLRSTFHVRNGTHFWEDGVLRSPWVDAAEADSTHLPKDATSTEAVCRNNKAGAQHLLTYDVASTNIADTSTKLAHGSLKSFIMQVGTTLGTLHSIPSCTGRIYFGVWTGAFSQRDHSTAKLAPCTSFPTLFPLPVLPDSNYPSDITLLPKTPGLDYFLQLLPSLGAKCSLGTG